MRWPWSQKRTNRDERIDAAARELEQSRAERRASAELARDLQQLRSENHITERIHRSMRGGEG